jgi:hypothetical protein
MGDDEKVSTPQPPLEDVLLQFVLEQGTPITTPDAQAFVASTTAKLAGVLPGVSPDPTQLLPPGGDEIGATFAYNAPVAALRFQVVMGRIAAPSTVFGFRFLDDVTKGITIPVQVTGRQGGGGWVVDITFDTLELLRQLGVRMLGRPIPV